MGKVKTSQNPDVHELHTSSFTDETRTVSQSFETQARDIHSESTNYTKLLENLHKVCRTCMMKFEEAKPLHEVLSINNKLLQLGDILCGFTSLKIAADDNLPQQICSQCEANLISGFLFQQQCYKSHLAFRNVIDSQQMDVGVDIKEEPLDIVEHSKIKLERIDEVPIKSVELQKIDDQNQKSLEPFYEDIQIEAGDQNEIYLEPFYENIKIETGEEDYFETNLPRIDLTVQNKLICQVGGCQESFLSFKELKDHKQKHVHPLCTICDTLFPGKPDAPNNLWKHLNQKHKVFYCNICSKVHRNAKVLLDHGEFHNKMRTKCKECGKILKGPRSMKRHSITHIGNRSKCRSCGELFVSIHKLKEHRKIHSDKRYICEVCHRPFVYISELEKHRKSHLKGEQTTQNETTVGLSDG